MLNFPDESTYIFIFWIFKKTKWTRKIQAVYTLRPEKLQTTWDILSNKLGKLKQWSYIYNEPLNCVWKCTSPGWGDEQVSSQPGQNQHDDELHFSLTKNTSLHLFLKLMSPQPPFHTGRRAQKGIFMPVCHQK